MARISIIIPDDMLKDLDERCSKLHYDRAEYIRGIIRDKIYFVPSVGERIDIQPSNYNVEANAPERDFEATIEADEPFLPEYTPGFCSKCFKKAEVKPVEYSDVEGNEFKETLCKTHVKKLEGFLKK